MENSPGPRASEASAHPEDEVLRSLRSFAFLHSQQRHRLQGALQSFTQAVAQLCDDDLTLQALLSLLGAVSGAVSGAVCGGTCGALGAIAAVTSSRVHGCLNPVAATVGLFGSVLGGVAGGVFSCTFGGGVGAAAEAAGRPVRRVVSDVVWFSVGFTSGGAIGGVFGGRVGAVGGAIGAGFGALLGTRFTDCLIGGIIGYFHGTKDSKEENLTLKKVSMMEKYLEFREVVEPLVKALEAVKMSSGPTGDRVAAVALLRFTEMEKAVVDFQAAEDLHRLTSGVQEAATLSQKVTEELETMRKEVEKLLEE